MENKIDDGGAAFPGAYSYRYCDKGPGDYKEETVYYAGMTLWDFFAAHALVGAMASETKENHFSDNEDRANHAFDVANAMLAERKKRFGGGG